MPERKAPFSSSVRKPSDAQLREILRPVPIKRCPSCGNSIISSVKFCNECLKLREYSMADSVKQFSPKQDTAQRASYPSGNHSGYSDLIPRKPIDPNRERY